MVADRDTAEEWATAIARPYRRRHGGVIAGYVSDTRTILTSEGAALPGGDKADGDTLFEIGSITKVFTAILAMRLSLESRLDLDAPIRGYLADFDFLPDWITARSLMTHTSGLPRIPDGISGLDKSNPYTSIDRGRLATWFAGRYGKRDFDPPGKPTYSNLGVGLLGLALGDILGTGYKQALMSQVIAPLGLRSTFCDVPAAETHRLAQPTRFLGVKVRVWDFDALAAAGTLKSSANDMAVFARAVMAAAGRDDIVSKAIVATTAVQVAGSKPFIPDTCLGWSRVKEKTHGTGILHHDGGTAGSASTLFICPELGFSLFALASSGTDLWTMVKLVVSDPAGVLSRVCAAHYGPHRGPHRGH